MEEPWAVIIAGKLSDIANELKNIRVVPQESSDQMTAEVVHEDVDTGETEEAGIDDT